MAWTLSASASDRAARVVAFGAPVALLLYYALPEGSYDSLTWLRTGVALWVLIGVGFAAGLLPRGSPRRAMIVPLCAIALLGAWTGLALTTTESVERTFLEVGRVAHLAGVLVLAWALLGPRTRTPAAYGLAAGGLLVCVLAVVSRLAPGWFPADALGEEGQLGRLGYPLDYWNALAAWAAMSLAMAIALSAHAPRPWIRSALMAATPWAGFAAYLTYSRGGGASVLLALAAALALSRNRWVAAAHLAAAAAGSVGAIMVIRNYPAVARLTGDRVELVLLAVLIVAGLACAAVAVGAWRAGGDSRWRVAPRTARIALAASAVLAIGLLVTVGGGAVSSAWDQFRGAATAAPGGGAEDPAGRLGALEGNRYAYWGSALAAFRSAPSTGIGPGTFEFWWSRAGHEEFVRDAHSLYIEHLGEAGWPGLLLVSAFILGLAVPALRARARPPGGEAVADAGSIEVGAAMGAAFLAYAFHTGIDWLWESTAVTVLALGCAAVACAPAAARTRPPRVYIRAPVLLLATVIVLAVLLPALVATAGVRESEEAFSAGDVPAAEAAAATARSAEPWAAAPYAQQALIAESQDRLEAARGGILEAVEREPTNWRHWFVLTRIEGELGDREAAADAFAEAKRLRPESEFLEEPPF